MMNSAPTLDNVTFSYNSTNWFGGGVSAMWSSPTIKNCNIIQALRRITTRIIIRIKMIVIINESLISVGNE